MVFYKLLDMGGLIFILIGIFILIVILFLIGLFFFVIAAVLRKRKKNSKSNTGCIVLIIIGMILSAPFVLFAILFAYGEYNSTQNHYRSIGQLLTAIDKNQYKKVQALLKDGCDVNNPVSGILPLIFASQKGEERIIQLLIDSGADVNAVDKEKGQTPLTQAVIKNRLNSVKVLLKNKADMNKKAGFSGESPIHYAIVYKSDIKIVSLLVSYKCNLNDFNNFDMNCLMAVVDGFQGSIISNRYNMDLIELFLSNGADINWKNKQGETALDYALFHKNNNGDYGQIIEFLKKKGALSGADIK